MRTTQPSNSYTVKSHTPLNEIIFLKCIFVLELPCVLELAVPKIHHS